MKKLLLLTLCITLLTSCNNDGKITLKQSTGSWNSLLIVMNNTEWQGKPGDVLRDIIASPVLGLPQEENQFSVNQVSVKTFNSFFKVSRNILFVGYDTANSFTISKDLYSAPQVAMTILAKDEASLIALIEKHKEEIISVFKDADIKLAQKQLRKNIWKVDSLKTLKNMGVSLNIPKDFKLVDDTGDFLWFRNHIAKGSMNIIAYELPLSGDENEVENAIVSYRDTIGKKHIPGSKEGMYMITEVAYSPHIKKTELSGKPSFETRGKWEVKGDFMAGPFLNYTVIDKKNNRLVVFEGFTYAPSVKKRDYMFELEAILKTLKI